MEKQTQIFSPEIFKRIRYIVADMAYETDMSDEALADYIREITYKELIRLRRIKELERELETLKEVDKID